MAKEVTFKLNLRVDGKDVVKKVTMDIDELQKAIGNAKTESDKLRDSLIKYNQINETIRSVSDCFAQLSGYLNDVTEESRSFGGAMAAANTMAGKSGQEFANLKDQVSELAGEIPVARDELANGLYQVISNGVPEDNWITFINVVIGIVACNEYFTLDPPAASVWGDVTVCSMLSLCITMPIWFIRLIHRLCKKLDGPSGYTPWWYGGL